MKTSASFLVCVRVCVRARLCICVHAWVCSSSMPLRRCCVKTRRVNSMRMLILGLAVCVCVCVCVYVCVGLCVLVRVCARAAVCR